MDRHQRQHVLSQKLSEFRHSLSYIDALPQLTLLALFIGILTGCIIVVFRWIIEYALIFFLDSDSENFESLNFFARFVFIAAGTVGLIFLMAPHATKDREIGVGHVLDRMHNHQSKLPFRNWVIQFIGAAICMISGQSAGREGPVVHLGAGAASQFGQWLKLPNNSIHTLVGCGVAAAISASFDTPMAGVIFAMEVLALEYTIVGFVPVILASVMGTMISKAVFSGSVFILVGDTAMVSLYETPIMVATGLIIALCAGIYIKLNIIAMRLNKFTLITRLSLAGSITAFAAFFTPAIMGQGYDTVNDVISGNLLLHSILFIAVVKLIVTPIVIGLGVPGGLIGPQLVIGACMGGALGLSVSSLFPNLEVNPSFYVLMGMAGMMAATLNAPLTALVTVLELTYSPNMIFPAMLVIVVSCVTTRQLFKVKGLFVEQLLHSKRPLDFGPAKQALRRAGVRSVMDTRFVVCEQKIHIDHAKKILTNHPMWLIITDENNRYSHIMRAADLANHLEQLDTNTDEEEPIKTIELLEIPSRAYLAGAIHESATLYEAMQGFKDESTEALYVSGQRTVYSGDVKGVLTLSSIENYYKPVEFRNAVD